MATLAQQYATALMRLSTTLGPELVVQKLETTLRTRGRLKLAPQIARELARLRARTSEPTLEVASEAEVSAAVAAAHRYGVTVSPTINPALIRGWRATTDSLLHDRSAKRALVNLYRSITSRT
jgi:F0F1-type ATP synthase delta subunit